MKTFHLQRRALLLGLLGAAIPGLAGAQKQAAESSSTSLLRRMFMEADNSRFSPESYSFEDSEMCVVSAEATEGPYYIEDPSLLRSDIREDREGAPLEVVLRIVKADGCRPVAGAAVDIWHCDAQGAYSGYTAYEPLVRSRSRGHAKPSDGETFLRGRQVADESGMVRFRTIYPGWYRSRTQHIHARVFLRERVAATIQLYFPDQLNREIALRKPYNRRPPAPYHNRNDFVIGGSGGADGSWLKMTASGDGYRGTLTVGIRA